MKIWFPGLSFGPVALKAGFLLDIWLLGQHLKIPPGDINLIPLITVWKSFMIFDTDWITSPIIGLITALPKAVWDFLGGWLDEMAKDFYERRGDEME